MYQKCFSSFFFFVLFKMHGWRRSPLRFSKMSLTTFSRKGGNFDFIFEEREFLLEKTTFLASYNSSGSQDGVYESSGGVLSRARRLTADSVSLDDEHAAPIQCNTVNQYYQVA